MSHLQVVRDERVGYGNFGQETRTREAYIKISRSFKTMLRELKGAPLAVFMAVACQEADIMLDDASPLTLSSIQGITGYSRPTVIDALDALVSSRFVTELPEHGIDMEKQYRVFSYSWFGDDGVMQSKKTLLARKNFSSIISSSINTSREKTFAEKNVSVTVEDPDGDGMFYCTGCGEQHALGDIRGSVLPCGCLAYVPGKKLLTLPDSSPARYLLEYYPNIQELMSEQHLKAWIALEREYSDETIMSLIDWARKMPFGATTALERIVRAIRKRYSPNRKKEPQAVVAHDGGFYV